MVGSVSRKAIRVSAPSIATAWSLGRFGVAEFQLARAEVDRHDAARLASDLRQLVSTGLVERDGVSFFAGDRCFEEMSFLGAPETPWTVVRRCLRAAVSAGTAPAEGSPPLWSRPPNWDRDRLWAALPGTVDWAVISVLTECETSMLRMLWDGPATLPELMDRLPVFPVGVPARSLDALVARGVVRDASPLAREQDEIFASACREAQERASLDAGFDQTWNFMLGRAALFADAERARSGHPALFVGLAVADVDVSDAGAGKRRRVWNRRQVLLRNGVLPSMSDEQGLQALGARSVAELAGPSHGPMTTWEMSRLLGVSQSRVSNTVESLVLKGEAALVLNYSDAWTGYGVGPGWIEGGDRWSEWHAVEDHVLAQRLLHGLQYGGSGLMNGTRVLDEIGAKARSAYRGGLRGGNAVRIMSVADCGHGRPVCVPRPDDWRRSAMMPCWIEDGTGGLRRSTLVIAADRGKSTMSISCEEAGSRPDDAWVLLSEAFAHGLRAGPAAAMAERWPGWRPPKREPDRRRREGIERTTLSPEEYEAVSAERQRKRDERDEARSPSRLREIFLDIGSSVPVSVGEIARAAGVETSAAALAVQAMVADGVAFPVDSLIERDFFAAGSEWSARGRLWTRWHWFEDHEIAKATLMALRRRRKDADLNALTQFSGHIRDRTREAFLSGEEIGPIVRVAEIGETLPLVPRPKAWRRPMRLACWVEAPDGSRGRSILSVDASPEHPMMSLALEDAVAPGGGWVLLSSAWAHAMTEGPMESIAHHWPDWTSIAEQLHGHWKDRKPKRAAEPGLR